MNTFTQLYNRYFYVREYKVKKEHTSKPYITEGIRKSIKHRNKLQKLSAKWPLTYEKEFKRYRNMLTSIIKIAIVNMSTLKDNARNPSKTWQIINDILKRKNRSNCKSFIVQGKSITDNQEIANGFNDYFCNIANKLAQSIEVPQKHFKDYLPPSVPFSFYFRPTNQHEVGNIIDSMKKKSPGHDDISISVIKACK